MSGALSLWLESRKGTDEALRLRGCDVPLRIGDMRVGSASALAYAMQVLVKGRCVEYIAIA